MTRWMTLAALLSGCASPAEEPVRPPAVAAGGCFVMTVEARPIATCTDYEVGFAGQSAEQIQAICDGVTDIHEWYAGGCPTQRESGSLRKTRVAGCRVGRAVLWYYTPDRDGRAVSLRQVGLLCAYDLQGTPVDP